MISKSYMPFAALALVIIIASLLYAPFQALVAGNWLLIIIFGVGAAALIGLAFKGTKIPKVVPRNQAILGGVLLLIFAVSTGLVNLGALGTAALIPGVITPVTTTPTGPSVIDLTACQQSVSPDVLGLSATLYINGYDMEANQPYAAAIDINPWWLIKNGIVQPYTDSSAYSAAGFSVGDVISVYGGGSTYYTAPNENICVNAQSYPLDISAHTITSEITGLLLVGYDSTAVTALSGGTNSSQEDYDITLGADQEDVFYLKLQVNATNSAFQLSGIATLAANDIDDVEVASGQGFTRVVVPDFLKNPIIMDNSITGNADSNMTGGYDDLWALDEPIMLHEWDEVKYKLTLLSGSTAPAANEDPLASDVVVVCFLDGSWARASDGLIKYGVYQQDDNEANIGMIESTSRPFGDGHGCVIIEGI